MTAGGQLGTALRQAAEEVTGYDVLEGAITRGRRRRRLSVASSAFAVLAVLGLTAAVAVPTRTDGEHAAAPPQAPSIPEHIGPPAPFTRGASGSPPGRASLIFSGDRGDLVVVGAATDSYRVIGTDAEPGWDALLSPTGDRVAYAAGDGIRVVDLVRGGTRSYPPADSTVDGFAPAAWLPDGTGLVALATTDPDDPRTQGVRRELSVLDLEAGALDEFAEATWPIATPGFAVAVSPDGSQIAYQFADFVTVYDRNTRAKTRFDLASYYFVLAGRAAWAPDGSLTLLHKRFASVGYAWELHLVDPADGTFRGVIPFPGSPTLIRLLGWSNGDPVVVSYEGPYSTMHGGPGHIILSGFDGTVGVHLLSGGQARVIVHPVDGISFIDVADQLLTDPRSRPGDPPWTLPLLGLWVPLVAVFLVAAVVIAARAVVRRQWRSMGLSPAAGDPDRS